MNGYLRVATDEFRDALKELAAQAGGYREVSRRSGVSHTYIGDLVKVPKKTPKFEQLQAIVVAFRNEYPELVERLVQYADVPGLRASSSLAANLIAGDDTADPPGARHIEDHGSTIPLGPPVSAHDVAGGGDETYETIDTSSWLRALGADYVLEVVGDCLEPTIHRGDLVAVKRARTARNGELVIARAIENGFTGELGDGYTLKVWKRDGNGGDGYYRADGTKALGALEAKVVGKIVGLLKKTLPSFK